MKYVSICVTHLVQLGKPTNGINLGRFGADTKLEFYLMRKFIDKSSIKPRKIILQYFVNDVDQFLPVHSTCSASSIPPSKLYTFIKEGSYLVNFIDAIYPEQNNVKLPSYCDYTIKLKEFYSTDSLWKKEEIQLDKFKNYCAVNDIKLTILFFPFMEDLNLSKQLTIDQQLMNYCTKNMLQFINVSDLIGDLSTKERQVSITDAHASEKVHQIVGKKIAYLLKN